MINRASKRRVAKRLGDLLRSLRRQKGWIQSQVGEAVGVDSVTIRKRELGLFSPSISRIQQVAVAYGVEVAHLIDAAEGAEQDDSTALIFIKGYVGTGTTQESGTGDFGTISPPLQMVQRYPDDYCLRVIGDSLVPDGINDGDVLLVCPDLAPTIGNLCVIDMDSRLCAVTYIVVPSHPHLDAPHGDINLVRPTAVPLCRQPFGTKACLRLGPRSG